MKNLKLALTALAVVATVSGALALKVQKFGTGQFYCSANPDGSNCSATKDYAHGGTTTLYCSDVSPLLCTTKITDIKSVAQ